MSAPASVGERAAAAKKAARQLASVPTAVKDRALRAAADRLEADAAGGPRGERRGRRGGPAGCRGGNARPAARRQARPRRGEAPRDGGGDPRRRRAPGPLGTTPRADAPRRRPRAREGDLPARRPRRRLRIAPRRRPPDRRARAQVGKRRSPEGREGVGAFHGRGAEGLPRHARGLPGDPADVSPGPFRAGGGRRAPRARGRRRPRHPARRERPRPATSWRTRGSPSSATRKGSATSTSTVRPT